MVPTGNKGKHLSSVNHTTKTIHHYVKWGSFWYMLLVNVVRTMLGVFLKKYP